MSLSLYRGEAVAEDAPLPGMIGEHPLMKAVYRLVRRVAPTDLPVLIVGETGTGKELVARALHELSGRPGAFVAFNVCAIAESMLEDAIFGHVKGAFTGASGDAPGYLMEAHRGTAFFDEIGGMPLAAQAKVLRAVETREFRPVGGRADRRSEFRVVAASSADLRELVGEGRFRRDLLERFHGVVIALPPLRQRNEDVPLLAASFLRLHDHAGLRFSDEALGMLAARSWAGNVRQLMRTVARLALAAEKGVISSDAIARECSDAGAAEHEGCRHELDTVLREAGWDVQLAAARMGVSRATLYRRLRDVGLRRPRLVSIRRETS